MKSDRLLSLDILRGVTIAGMILVNNPGSWENIYTPLQHAVWNGLTPTDLIFPFFMFIMGISTFISLRKYKFEFSKLVLRKIIKRTFVIFLIGLGLSWLSVSFSTYHNLASDNLSFSDRLVHSISNFEHLRILGVMQRLAITYGATSLIAIFFKHKYIPFFIVITLLGYFILLLFGNGFSPDGNNILAVTDQKVLGLNHMFVEFELDPEGILSTIPSICHVLIGFCCGKLLMEGTKDNTRQMLDLFIVGASLAFLGYLISYGCPINKKIWSPTYVLITCGMGAALLSLLIWIIDVKEYKTWCIPFRAFGVNPLFIYVLAGVLATILEGTYIIKKDTFICVKDYLYEFVLSPLFGDYPASLIYAFAFVSITWFAGYILYKKEIYIKI